ncbi:MAG: hypothetical protein JW769_05475 [Parachlamydiales bacterium]|nr:hypothetical protein [Parachlamydiales bacterium]
MTIVKYNPSILPQNPQALSLHTHSSLSKKIYDFAIEMISVWGMASFVGYIGIITGLITVNPLFLPLIAFAVAACITSQHYFLRFQIEDHRAFQHWIQAQNSQESSSRLGLSHTRRRKSFLGQIIYVQKENDEKYFPILGLYPSRESNIPLEILNAYKIFSPRTLIEPLYQPLPLSYHRKNPQAIQSIIEVIDEPEEQHNSIPSIPIDAQDIPPSNASSKQEALEESFSVEQKNALQAFEEILDFMTEKAGDYSGWSSWKILSFGNTLKTHLNNFQNALSNAQLNQEVIDVFLTISFHYLCLWCNKQDEQFPSDLLEALSFLNTIIRAPTEEEKEELRATLTNSLKNSQAR